MTGIYKIWPPFEDSLSVQFIDREAAKAMAGVGDLSLAELREGGRQIRIQLIPNLPQQRTSDSGDLDHYVYGMFHIFSERALDLLERLGAQRQWYLPLKITRPLRREAFCFCFGETFDLVDGRSVFLHKVQVGDKTAHLFMEKANFKSQILPPSPLFWMKDPGVEHRLSDTFVTEQLVSEWSTRQFTGAHFTKVGDI